MSENVFVFVVCGTKEHIDTLHFSMGYLKRFSRNRILILTDSSRNEIEILHDNVIDIKTPESFNHHQASIYLKTGIYQFLPKGNNYCYLDTDVIAFSNDVDEIFNEFIPPVRFAPDHCVMPVFSPSAVHCSCLTELEEARQKFEGKLNEIDPLRMSDDLIIQQNRKQLQTAYLEIKKNFFKTSFTAVRYLLSPSVFKLTSDIQFDKKTRVWKTASGTAFMSDFNIRKVTKSLGFKWSYLKKEPQLQDGRSIWRDQCYHLKEQIQGKFNIVVKDDNFQHWNGGVFLFNDSSHEFLANWFDYTMEIFGDLKWKTRDQGTLIATVWKFGLENHPTLDKRWNLIADFYNPYLGWSANKAIRLSEKLTIEPAFIHVYHHFEDEKWGFWNQLMNHLSKK